MMFDKWDHRFMEMAQLVSSWASCYQQDRKIGAVIVKDKRVMTTGYNGAPAGVKTCVERGECLRKKLGIPSGTRHEMCYAVHAEQNAIIQAAKLGVSIDGATLYCTHQPCILCAKMICIPVLPASYTARAIRIPSLWRSSARRASAWSSIRRRPERAKAGMGVGICGLSAWRTTKNAAWTCCCSPTSRRV